MFNTVTEILKKGQKEKIKHIFLPLLTMHYGKIIENDRFRDRLVSKKIKESKLLEALK